MYRRLLEVLNLVKPHQPHLPQNNVSNSLSIEEVALHAANDWYDTAIIRSDVRADLNSYYEGFRDAMRFCQGNDR